MSAGMPEGHDGIGGGERRAREAILSLSHALITLAATTRLICIDTRHPMPKENLGVAAEALRKAGYSEAAEQVGK